MTAEPKRLSVAAAKLEALRLFEFLSPDAKPVASKSRRYNQEDQAFIEAEVGHLLAADVIEPSRSPWRRQAYHQVPFLPEERHFTAFEAAGRLYQYKRLFSGSPMGFLRSKGR